MSVRKSKSAPRNTPRAQRERRIAPRFYGGIPVGLNGRFSGARWHAAIVKDFSESGLYLCVGTRYPELDLKQPIDFRLLIPLRLMEPIEVHCSGTPVRVEWLGNGSLGVALQISSYQVPLLRRAVQVRPAAWLAKTH